MRIVLKCMAAVVLFAAFTACGSSGRPEPEANEVVLVEVERVSRRDISNEIMLVGTVRAVTETAVVPRISGMVEAVNVQIGDLVESGDVLMVVEDDALEDRVEQARLTLEGANANYRLTLLNVQSARDSLENSRQLFKQGMLSKQQLEQAEIAASDEYLKPAQNAVNQAEFALMQAGKALKDAEIRAPADGVVASVAAGEGDFVSVGKPVVVITGTDEMLMDVGVTESLVNKLYKGQKVRVCVNAVSENAEGIIRSISPAADSRTKLFAVTAGFGGSGKGIKPGMFARVYLKSDEKKNVIAVRSEAVIQDGGGKAVFKAWEGKAVKKPVKTGLDTGTYVEIAEGLSEGDLLIIVGQNYLSDGDSIKVAGGGMP